MVLTRRGHRPFSGLGPPEPRESPLVGYRLIVSMAGEAYDSRESEAQNAEVPILSYDPRSGDSCRSFPCECNSAAVQGSVSRKPLDGTAVAD